MMHGKRAPQTGCKGWRDGGVKTKMGMVDDNNLIAGSLIPKAEEREGLREGETVDHIVICPLHWLLYSGEGVAVRKRYP